MALIKAQHDVYGVVEVPDTYPAMWPEYEPLSDEAAADAERVQAVDGLEQRTVDELKADLSARGLPTGGKKSDLVQRLVVGE